MIFLLIITDSLRAERIFLVKYYILNVKPSWETFTNKFVWIQEVRSIVHIKNDMKTLLQLLKFVNKVQSDLTWLSVDFHIEVALRPIFHPHPRRSGLPTGYCTKKTQKTKGQSDSVKSSLWSTSAKRGGAMHTAGIKWNKERSRSGKFPCAEEV